MARGVVRLTPLTLGLSRDGQLEDIPTGQRLGAGVPAGVIVLWSGTLAAIPAGWALCDGSNGTPDLRSRFVKGAAAGVDPGATGGAATHTHDAHPALGHAGTAVADHASHTHDGASVIADPDLFISAAGTDSVRTGGPDATLTHAVTQPNDHASQAHVAANHEPAYFALAYIMRT